MEGFRCKSFRDGEMQRQIEGGGPSNMQGLRCYSANYTANSVQPNQINKMKKSKSSSSTSKTWTSNHPELQRKKRVAAYKAYTVQGKMSKSFMWLKNTFLNSWR
ncbi:type 1 diacylglycerol acyltransferase [Hibiscus syriacus]|uniref:Type 1 diacylglycerol acyltransferase n=1 Tax=Hibiscus syriacus TaxID=106335 RepID=A0A6A2Z967_HIBSY|nr:uncharacterized protein LOC120148507 [Hibiscus syriacus]XP_039017618.1 uncharacterized protein LOC120148612 [Hibiscus syriacus]KAE8688534.1 type 1 diacylglycerol acyltransferase [Hibiscus syriacus]KAE8688646.1 type 1 diacylglycerol acyltransferase [Hibiscus syriacus]